MNVEQSLFQFIDFYLLPFLSKKSIDLLKVKLDRKAKNISDPFLREVTLIREALDLVNSRRKPAGHVLVAESLTDRFYVEILRLKPRDCLIFISNHLFELPLNQLSIALKTSAESLEFRRAQLVQQFEEDGFPLSELKKINSSSSTPALAGSSNKLFGFGIGPGRSVTERSASSPGSSSNRSLDQLGILQSFQKLPLALRFAIETGLILIGLLGLLWLIPEIRNRYENSIQKRINDYLIESSLVDSPAPAGTSKTAKPLTTDPAAAAATDEEEDAAGINKSSSDELSSRKQPKVNEGETWRFSFTGSATTEIESGVLDSIQKLSITSDKPLTVPGGIQFNFVLAVDRVIPLKNALEQLVTDISQKGNNKLSGMNVASFSWYKKRNMGTRKIPSGHVQVIVWISTL